MRTFRAAYGASQRGFALVIALGLLTVITCLAVHLCHVSSNGLVQSANHTRIQAARMQAESGQAYITYVLSRASLPLAGTGEKILDAVAVHLDETLSNSPAVQGSVSMSNQGVITVPDVVFGSPRESFRAELWMFTPETLRMRITGVAGNVQRRVVMDFALDGGHPVFGFGISSKGPICLENIVSICGANDPTEARLLSMASGTAFRLEDQLTIDGDVYTTDANAEVVINGTGTIGGTSMSDPNVWNHVHMGAPIPDFPEIDPSLFEPYAREILNSGTVTSGTRTFDNVRIAANTNPTFSGSITLRGVIFVETPNRVTFGSGTTIQGVVVTQRAPQPTPDNEIRFESNTYSYGTETLPDTGLFKEIREMTGSFVLAPGFRVRFENESGVLSGMVAAYHVKFENAFNGTLRGGIICYGTEEMVAENGSDFTIDRAYYPGVPAGFNVDDRSLVPLSGSYVEE
jgi:hypothetical protein